MSELFLSYTHDSPERTAQLKGLAERLRDAGLRVRLDQDEMPAGPDEGWPQWSEIGAADTERVLLIPSATYYECWCGRQPPGMRNGATWEAQILANRVYEREDRGFIRCAYFDPADRQHIPAPLRGYHAFDATTDLDGILAWAQGKPAASNAATPRDGRGCGRHRPGGAKRGPQLLCGTTSEHRRGLPFAARSSGARPSARMDRRHPAMVAFARLH